MAGANFGTDAAAISVSFGPSPCAVVAAAGSELSCELLPVGAADMEGVYPVVMVGTSPAEVEASADIEFRVSSVFPNRGSVHEKKTHPCARTRLRAQTRVHTRTGTSTWPCDERCWAAPS